MSTPAERVRSTLGPRRVRGDDKLFARAKPEKVEITESYAVQQEISRSPSMQRDGDGTGRIEMRIPYDGRDYFTRQAADDVERASTAGRAADGMAVVGRLMLMGHERTDLRTIPAMQRHNQVGVIPLAVPVTSADGSLQLTADKQTCVIGYDYSPHQPPVYPLELDISLYDRDNLSMSIDQFEDQTLLGQVNPSEIIEKLRQEASFSNELMLSIRVKISLPVKKNYPDLAPVIKRMSIDWPEITSLRTTWLCVARPLPGQGMEIAQVPVRYNPASEHKRLEWEDIPAGGLVRSGDDGDDGEAGMRVYLSELMVLNIGHPGELLNKETLAVNAEVKIPGYLLSGVESRLFSATGGVQKKQPDLVTELHISTTLYPADVFAGRTFMPYQQFVFDDIIPDEMRITDIVTVLRNSRFQVDEPRPDPANKGGSRRPKWLLRARRSQGPDDLDLLVAVEGKRDVLDRTQVLADNTVRLQGDKESGQLTISVLGMLPRDHKELTREMNALQGALRDRFRFQQAGRR